ncbi:MAG: hypothetical protein ACM369_02680 [Acidobacteriota bacterium]
MKYVALARRSLDALFVALLASSFAGCVSSAWERTEKVTSNGSDARLYVPKLWAPLLPGSVYPNKRVPVHAKGRPSVVVVCPAAGSCPKDRLLAPLAERGLVVLLFERPPNEPPREDLLRTRAESAGAPTGWLLISPTDDFLRRWMGPGSGSIPAVVAILQGRAPATALPSLSSPSRQVFGSVTRRVMLGALLGSEADVSSDGVIEKLYAPDLAGRLPREAYRDAAEWLAGELGAR